MKKKKLYEAIEHYREQIKDLKVEHYYEIEKLQLQLKAHKAKIEVLEQLDSDQLIEYAIKNLTVREIPEDFEPKAYQSAVVEGKE